MAPFRRHLRQRDARVTKKFPPSKAFLANRLNEPQLATGEVDSGGENSDHEEELHEESPSEEEEDDDDIQYKHNPYSALLLSLNPQASTDEPARKKRKVSRDAPGTVPKFPDGPNLPPTNGADQVDDHLDEPVTVEEDDQDEDIGDVDSDEDDLDPFQEHFNTMDEDELKAMIQELSRNGSRTRTTMHDIWKVNAALPLSSSALAQTGSSLVSMVPQDRWVKEKLRRKARLQLAATARGLPSTLAAMIFKYEDVMFCGRSVGNRKSLQDLWCLHVLNHVLKTRDKVLKNTARLSKAGAGGDVEYRDQGFTRPKVLILLPTRQACAHVVDTIISFYQPEQQENKKRFSESFSQETNDISEDKPLDFRELFGGNDNDLFRLGLKFTRKTVKFFSQFYSSDIIIASPLGLRMAMGAEESKKHDSDFLSSIEVVVVDHADALLMQNWEHVEFVFDHLNSQPKEAHGCDFSRVRHWYLDGNAKYIRQTILISSFNTPELNQLYTHHMRNVLGRSKITLGLYDGALLGLDYPVKQHFIRFDAPEPHRDPDARFTSFSNTVIPRLTKLAKLDTAGPHGILIFIPSYMDFVRVRNFLANSTVAQNIPFGSISEYTAAPEVARARSHFLTGRHAVLLYSGRAHHFRRYKFRGVKQVIMYALPENSNFYKEIAGEYLARSISHGAVTPEEASVRSLFSKWDILKLERIVGTQRVKKMLNDTAGDTFDFV